MPSTLNKPLPAHEKTPIKGLGSMVSTEYLMSREEIFNFHVNFSLLIYLIYRASAK